MIESQTRLVIIDPVALGHDGHLACCRHDATFCGAPYHPEVIATDDGDEDDACPTCVDVRYDHMHGVAPNVTYTCPLTGAPCP